MALSRVAVIDYGMGNLHSVAKALEHVADGKHNIQITHDADIIRQADRVVFPGVGAMRDCMAEIKRLKIDILIKQAITEKPVLAVCVGMQALFQHSAENDGVDCLDVFPGEVKSFSDGFSGDLISNAGEKLKVPHMGWNTVQQTGSQKNSSHPMWKDISNSSYFYFVHSYCVGITEANKEFVVGECNYGKEFVAAITKPNLFATQFHPEKSHKDGLQLYNNFLNWDGMV